MTAGLAGLAALFGGGAEALRREAEVALAEARRLLDEVLATPRARTLEVYNRLRIVTDDLHARVSLLTNVHPDPGVRDAAEAAEREVSAFLTDLGLNRPLYELLQGIDPAPLDAEARRLVERTLRDFRRAGVDRDEPTRARLRELADLQVELGQRHAKNIREDVREVRLDPAQLDGLPDDYRAAHPPGPDGKVRITTDYPDYIPFRTYARDAAARRELFRVYQNRAHPANEPVFRQLLEARREQARLLGYAHWADYVTEDKMIRSAKAVEELIARVAHIAEAPARRDVDLLLARKRQDLPDATEVDQAESSYYEELCKRERFAFDSQEVRAYFEFSRTLAGLLETTGRIFGVTYRAVPDAPRWHADVAVHDVLLEGQPIGRIYLDLHPRDGKYKHAAQFTVTNGVRGIQLPEGALVCNFPDPKRTNPALLEHDEVVTLFHEFGHLMHHVLGGQQRWVYFSGVATEWDFVEAPSQMLEEWAWDHGTLARFARHLDTGAPIPLELVTRMRAADEVGKGAHARHQMFYAAMSLAYHTAPDPAALDLQRVMVDLQRRYSPFRFVDGTAMWASFGHLVGYSAMYYTYMWSLVIAKDLLSAFEAKGLLDPGTCRRYRDEVLSPGGARDAADLVRAFLGRPFAFDAFQRWLEG